MGRKLGVGAALLVAAAFGAGCGGSNATPDEYTEQDRSEFVGACAVNSSNSRCECMYAKFKNKVAHDEFLMLNAKLADGTMGTGEVMAKYGKSVIQPCDGL